MPCPRPKANPTPILQEAKEHLSARERAEDGRRSQTGNWTNRHKKPTQRPQSAQSRGTDSKPPTNRTHTTTRSEAEAKGLTFGVDLWETAKPSSYTKKHYMPGRDNTDNYGDEKVAINTMFKINYGW